MTARGVGLRVDPRHDTPACLWGLPAHHVFEHASPGTVGVQTGRSRSSRGQIWRCFKALPRSSADFSRWPIGRGLRFGDASKALPRSWVSRLTACPQRVGAVTRAGGRSRRGPPISPLRAPSFSCFLECPDRVSPYLWGIPLTAAAGWVRTVHAHADLTAQKSPTSAHFPVGWIQPRPSKPMIAVSHSPQRAISFQDTSYEYLTCRRPKS